MADGRLPNTGQVVPVGPCSIGDVYTFTILTTPNLAPTLTLNDFLPNDKQTFSTDAFSSNIHTGNSYSPRFTGDVVSATNNKVMVSSVLQDGYPLTTVNSGVSPDNVPLPAGQIDSLWTSDLGPINVRATKVSGIVSSPNAVTFSGTSDAHARVGISDVYMLALPSGDTMSVTSFTEKGVVVKGAYALYMTPYSNVSAAAGPDFVAIKLVLATPGMSGSPGKPPSRVGPAPGSNPAKPKKTTMYACEDGLCVPSPTGTFFTNTCSGVCSPQTPKKGLSVTIIIIIVVAALVVVGIAGYGIHRHLHSQKAAPGTVKS